MSVVSFPRRVDTRRAKPRSQPTTPQTQSRRGNHGDSTSRRWLSTAIGRKSTIIVLFAVVVSLGGSMVEANRQIEIHDLQNQLLQDQSSYAVQAGSLTNLSAPSLIATQAGALHLVDPTVVTQVPSTSLDAPLPLPKFSGYAPATSRTLR